MVKDWSRNSRIKSILSGKAILLGVGSGDGGREERIKNKR
jgi:hypothetical protein